MIPLTESETRARRRTGLVHRVDLLSGRGYWLRPALAYLICFAILVSANYLAYAGMTNCEIVHPLVWIPMQKKS